MRSTSFLPVHSVKKARFDKEDIARNENNASSLGRCNGSVTASSSATASTTTEKSRRLKVSFSDCKKYDGLAPRSERTFRTLRHVVIWRLPVDESFFLDITHNFDATITHQLLVDLQEVICRLSTVQTCPLLLRGGGMRSYRLVPQHLGLIIKLVQVLTQMQQVKQ